MDAATLALQRQAAGHQAADFTNTLLSALQEVAAQGTPSSWAPKPRNPLLPESDVESIAGLPPGDTPRSAWQHRRSHFDSYAHPGEDEDDSQHGVNRIAEEPARSAGSGAGEIAAGSHDGRHYSRDEASDDGSEEEPSRSGRTYLETLTTTLLPSVVGFGLALLLSGVASPLLRPRKQRPPQRPYEADSQRAAAHDLFSSGGADDAEDFGPLGGGDEADFPVADAGEEPRADD